MRRGVVPALVAVGLAGGPLAVSQSLGDAPARFRSVRADTFVRIEPGVVGGPIQPGFVGLSSGYPALLGYSGADPRAPNPVLEQLIHDLAPGQPPAATSWRSRPPARQWSRSVSVAEAQERVSHRMTTRGS